MSIRPRSSRAKNSVPWCRSARFRQISFAFIERSRRHERWFKRLIMISTCIVLAVILRVIPRGRYVSAEITARARQAARQAVGVPKSRAEIDESWQRYREMGIETQRKQVESFYRAATPEYRRMLDYAGMDPDRMILRWANYNWTILLSSKVFDIDDKGRSYRFKPLTRSIWLIHTVAQTGGPMFYILPDGPGLADAVRGVTGVPLESSRQTTNSWGLRGPEPDPGAPLRGIVLGDSYMQGMFIGDNETPPECLSRYLHSRLKTKVSILNTGVMGYSPEQYYYTLIAFADRFKPHFVIVSVFVNDFGYMGDVGDKGVGDWEEGKFWLEKIIRYCQARQCLYLIVPVPFVTHLTLKRKSGYYPGTLANMLETDSLKYFYPIEDFANAQSRGPNAGGQPLVQRSYR
jgi:hypothetical protein